MLHNVVHPSKNRSTLHNVRQIALWTVRFVDINFSTDESIFRLPDGHNLPKIAMVDWINNKISFHEVH